MNLNLLELVPEYYKCPICGLWHKSFSDEPLKTRSTSFILWDCKTYKTYYPKCYDPEHRNASIMLFLYPKKEFFEFKIGPLPGCRHILPINLLIDFDDMIIGKEHPTITANLQLKLENSQKGCGCRYCDYKSWCNMKTKNDENERHISLNMTVGLAFNREEFDKTVCLDDKNLRRKELEVGPDYDEPVNLYLPYSPTEEAVNLVNQTIE